MSRVHRRGVVAASGRGVKTYAEFVAHITALAVDGERAWSSRAAWTTGAWTTPCDAATETMIGSSWNTVFRGNSTNTAAARVIQHGLSGPEVFADQVANSRQVFFRTLAVGDSLTGFAALDRNGFLSSASVNTTGAIALTELIRWDGTQAWISNPSTGGAETLYIW